MKIDDKLYQELNAKINRIIYKKRAYNYLCKEDIEDFTQEVFLRQLQVDRYLDFNDIERMFFIFSRRISNLKHSQVSIEEMMERDDN